MKKIRFSVKTSSSRIPQVKTRSRDNARGLGNEPYEICMDDFISGIFPYEEKVALFSKVAPTLLNRILFLCVRKAPLEFSLKVHIEIGRFFQMYKYSQ